MYPAFQRVKRQRMGMGQDIVYLADVGRMGGTRIVAKQASRRAGDRAGSLRCHVSAHPHHLSSGGRTCGRHEGAWTKRREGLLTDGDKAVGDIAKGVDPPPVFSKDLLGISMFAENLLKAELKRKGVT